MEGVCRGARRNNGTTVGLLPGLDPNAGNPDLTIIVPTGLGEGRNSVLINSVESVICIGESWGTLSEVALALRASKPCTGLACRELGWEDPGITTRMKVVDSPEEAVRRALGVERARDDRS